MAVIPDAKTLKVINERPFMVACFVLFGVCTYLYSDNKDLHKQMRENDEKTIQYSRERIEGLEDNLKRSDEIFKTSSLLIEKRK